MSNSRYILVLVAASLLASASKAQRVGAIDCHANCERIGENGLQIFRELVRIPDSSSIRLNSVLEDERGVFVIYRIGDEICTINIGHLPISFSTNEDRLMHWADVWSLSNVVIIRSTGLDAIGVSGQDPDGQIEKFIYLRRTNAQYSLYKSCTSSSADRALMVNIHPDPVRR